MASNRTAGKREKGKIDQFFPRVAKGNVVVSGDQKDNNQHNHDSDHDDDDDDDDQYHISLSELVGRKRPRLNGKPQSTSFTAAGAKTWARTGGAVTRTVQGPASSKQQGTQDIKVTKNINNAKSDATSDMIETVASTLATITTNNNNNPNRGGNNIDHSTGNLQSSTDGMNNADVKSNDTSIADTNNHNSTSQATTPTSTLIRPAPVPSLRRCLGHAVTDFVPPEPTNNKPNWLDRLFQRSLKGHRLNANSIPESCHNWVKSPSSRVALTSPSTTIEYLAWDSLGALLCVAGPRTIFIYDWDMLRAADMASKADRQRQTNAHYQIPPLLQFSVPHAISHLQWNPYHPDQLAVGFKVQGILHLYQLDAVLAWREKHPSSLYPPRSCFQPLQPTSPPSKGSVHALLFLPNNLIVASMGSTLSCWNSQYTLLWRYQLPAMGACLSSIHATWILVATVQGQFLMIDAGKTERAALSLQCKPLLLHAWIPKTIQRVMNCQIIPLLLDTTNNNSSFQLLWITEDGFVYQTTIVISHHDNHNHHHHHSNPNTVATNTTTSTKSSSTVVTTTGTRKMPSSSPTPLTKVVPIVTYGPKIVIYSPPKLSIYNHANQEHIADNQYSIPPETIISHYTPIAWIWPQVPKMSKYLGPHDKFVVDRMKIVRDPDRAFLLWYPGHGGGKSVSIPAPLQQQATSLPTQVVALHPDSEWMVMGVGTELVLLANRCSVKKKKSFIGLPSPVDVQPPPPQLPNEEEDV